MISEYKKAKRFFKWLSTPTKSRVENSMKKYVLTVYFLGGGMLFCILVFLLVRG